MTSESKDALRPDDRRDLAPGRAAERGIELASLMLAPGLRKFGAFSGASVSEWQWQNVVPVLERAHDKRRERGLEHQALPPEFLLPILEAARNVTNDQLRERWAELLANGAADERNRHPSFASTLSGMNVEDAMAFAAIAGDQRSSAERARWNGLDKPRQAEVEHRLVALRLTELRRVRPNVGMSRRKDNLAERLHQAMQQETDSRVVSGYGMQFGRAIGVIADPPMVAEPPRVAAKR